MIWQYAKKTSIALAVLLLLGMSVAAVVTKARHGELLSVQSGSMVPHFHKGDLVSVTRVPTAQLQRGDIITFINPKNHKQTITHRIIQTPSSQHPNQFVTKGDANPAADQPIPTTSVIGRAGWSVPYLGYIADFIRKPLGLMLIIYVPAIFIVWSELVRLSKYYEKQRPYVLAGYHHALDGPSSPTARITSAFKFVLMLIVAALLGLAMPAHALLRSTAALKGNTIRAVNPASQPHLVISEVFLNCSSRNSKTASRTPLILIYNPTDMKIKLKGWTLRDNSGTIMTFPNRTIVKHQIYIVSLYLRDGGLSGLQYAGDRVGLYTDGGQEIDGLSWGTDVSEFDPSIQGVTPGTTMLRKPANRDTNTAADWKLRDVRCAGEDKTSDQSSDDGNNVQTGDATVSNQTSINVQINNGSSERTMPITEPPNPGDFRIAVTADH